jgi:hypothetical protein
MGFGAGLPVAIGVRQSPGPIAMRRVFYSFHYDRDIWRVSQVRHSGRTKQIEPSNQIIDHAAWEAIKKKGDAAVRDWIESQFVGAGVTVVLIGAETCTRQWVYYEIRRSYELRKGIVGVRIHGLADQNRQTDQPGPNPLDYVSYKENIGLLKIDMKYSYKYKTYDYVLDDGYNNLPTWVEEAARIAGR